MIIFRTTDAKNIGAEVDESLDEFWIGDFLFKVIDRTVLDDGNWVLSNFNYVIYLRR